MHILMRDSLRSMHVILSALMLSMSAVIIWAVWWRAGGGAADAGGVLACYYNTPRAEDRAPLAPAAIEPTLCTHINVAFARVLNRSLHLEAAQAAVLRQVVALKELNPALKVLISVGGAGRDDGFSEMVADHASRKIFIRSVKESLRALGADGIDLDWEFPGLQRGARERQHFSQLLREIRAEYERERRPYLLTVAVAAPAPIVDVSYDVDQIDLYADFANVMSYDYHYYSRFTPFTGLNSPLYRRAAEDLYPATLNVNHTVHMYLAKGLRRTKIALGIPAYGHSFALVNPANPSVGAPASGVGALGAGGFADYPAACEALRGGARLRLEAEARVPYLFRGADWLSFEDPRSAAEKARFARQLGLRGAMLYSLNADDHGARCGAGPFPLARAVRAALAP